MKLKFFLVKIDNDPGGWKSGEDPKTIVIANNKEEAIQMVKDGYWDRYDYEENHITYNIQSNNRQPYISTKCKISAVEIQFQMPNGYEISISNVRKEKLKKIQNEM